MEFGILTIHACLKSGSITSAVQLSDKPIHLSLPRHHVNALLRQLHRARIDERLSSVKEHRESPNADTSLSTQSSSPFAAERTQFDSTWVKLEDFHCNGADGTRTPGPYHCSQLSGRR